MRRALRAVICALIGVALPYPFFAFGAWELNPSLWPVEVRLACAMLMAGAAFYLVVTEDAA